MNSLTNGNLSDKIWVTYKCRINAHSRLKECYYFFEIMLVYYAIFPVIFSILNLKLDSDLLNIGSVISSVFVLVFSVFISAQKFNDRSESHKACYIQLQSLYEKCKFIEDKPDKINDLVELNDQYISLLNLSANHSPSDYLLLQLQLRNSRNKTVRDMQWENWSSLVYYYVKRVFWVLLFVLFPIVGTCVLLTRCLP